MDRGNHSVQCWHGMLFGCQRKKKRWKGEDERATMNERPHIKVPKKWSVCKISETVIHPSSLSLKTTVTQSFMELWRSYSLKSHTVRAFLHKGNQMWKLEELLPPSPDWLFPSFLQPSSHADSLLNWKNEQVKLLVVITGGQQGRTHYNGQKHSHNIVKINQ